MFVRSHRLLTLFAGCVIAGLASAQNALYVKVADLSPSGETTYEGADIEAIELLSPAGTVAYYAAEVIDSHKPKNPNNAEISAETVIGLPVPSDWNVPYVFSMNGGWVIARVDTPGTMPADEWRLSIYEVDGSLYSWGDGPEPYRVSISDSADGPWRDLGIGSGTARFTLGASSDQRFDDELVESIEAVLEEIFDNEPMTEKQRTDVSGFTTRLAAINDIKQLQTELVGLYTFFNYTEHVVNDHGELDGGRVMRARLLLQTAWDRYRSITGS